MYRSNRNLALVAALLIPVGATAQDWNDGGRGWDSPTYASSLGGRLVDVQIQVDGDEVSLFAAPRRDDPRRYFEARAGRNYSVVLRNRTGHRIGVLLAVDGLNVVDGAHTDLSQNEAMYVLDPWERATIRGWRTSLDHVQRFVFVDERHSYAARSGQANSDLGWIRVLAFREQTPWYAQHRDGWKRQERDALPPPVSEDRHDSKASPQAPNASPQTLEKVDGSKDRDAAPGTGWGDRRYDPVNATQFTADGPAVDHLILRYEYARGLAALGIDTRHAQHRDRWRERDGDLGFALPPRW